MTTKKTIKDDEATAGTLFKGFYFLKQFYFNMKFCFTLQLDFVLKKKVLLCINERAALQFFSP